MRLIFTARFERDYKKLSSIIQKKTDEKLLLLAQDSSHPSLRVKKIKRYNHLFECSITQSYRALFTFGKDCCILHQVGTHDILDKL